jgi:osmotically inducible protein OsmC
LSQLFGAAARAPLQVELPAMRFLPELLRFLLIPETRQQSPIYNEHCTFQVITKEIRMQRKASAVWKGGLKDGKGAVSADSGVLAGTPYSFVTRFENTPGTNPEELIAAAHAACFSMALSAQLGGANLTPSSINTTATLSLEKLDAGWAITTIHLDVVGRVPGADDGAFQKAAENAKSGCPVSKVLNAKITMTAKLEG